MRTTIPGHGGYRALLLVDTIPSADWPMFVKNGSDATTTCATTAERWKVMVAHGRGAVVLSARRRGHRGGPGAVAGCTARQCEHNEEVLCKLGYSDEEISDFTDRGVLIHTRDTN